jgi:hypothetical protein
MNNEEIKTRKIEELTEEALEGSVESRGRFTVAFQYDSDGGPADPPSHIVERVMAATQIFHELGYALDVRWGTASEDLMDMIDEGN